MRAIIIGAGVGGPTTALALQQAGIDASIYEARDAIEEDIGSYLTVATNGLAALRAIDAHLPVLALGFATGRTTMSSGRGKSLGSVPIGATRGDASRTMKRADLHRALSEQARTRGVPIAFGKRFVAAETTATCVRATFADGSAVEGDVLVGCDGVHSVVRSTLDSSAPAPRYVGLLNFGGYTPGTSVGEPGAWHMVFGRRAFFGYAPDGAGGTVWFANVPRHPTTAVERQQTPAHQWIQLLVDLFSNDRGPARELIAAGRLELAGVNTYDVPTVHRWHRNRRVIIGDAAHAPSPSSGQGASMAIEDGIVLAQCLRDAPDITTALTVFERNRRPRVERIVAQGARSSSAKAVGRAGAIVRDLCLPWVFRYLVTDRALAWMYDHRIDWHQPMALDGFSRSGTRVARTHA